MESIMTDLELFTLLTQANERLANMTDEERDEIAAEAAQDKTGKPRGKVVKAPCWKCSRKGVISTYKHVAGGECFACGGHG